MNEITLIQLLSIINQEDCVRVHLVDRITGEIKGHMEFGVWKTHTSAMAKTFVEKYKNNPVYEMCAWSENVIGIFIIEQEAN